MYQIFDVTDGCGEPEILEGGRAGCTFCISYQELAPFQYLFSKKFSRIALAHNHFSKPEWRGSYRGRANCAKAHANIALEAALVVPKGSLKLYSFV